MDVENTPANYLIPGTKVRIANKDKPKTYNRVGTIVNSDGEFRAVRLEDGIAPWYYCSELEEVTL